VQQRVESICDTCRPILAENVVKPFQSKSRCETEDVLAECDMLHMYPCQDVQVWARVLEWVDHVVRHVRAGASRRVDPSIPQKYKRHDYTTSGVKYART
jgi:3-methyladenine DNA glycosylase AlkC